METVPQNGPGEGVLFNFLSFKLCNDDSDLGLPVPPWLVIIFNGMVVLVYIDIFFNGLHYTSILLSERFRLALE